MEISNTKINWYAEICKNESKLTDAIAYFNAKYEEFAPSIKIQYD